MKAGLLPLSSSAVKLTKKVGEMMASEFMEEAFELVCSSQGEVPAFEKLKKQAQALGFEYCGYGLKTPIPVSRPKFIMIDNYAREWRDAYVSRNYASIDPIIKHCLRSTAPFVWSARSRGRDSEFFRAADEHGISHGWSQSVWDRHGCCGTFTAARSADAIMDDEIKSSGERLSWLANTMHAMASEQMLPRILPEVDICFSRREMEVIKWSAEGKTSEDMAQILSITSRTVNFHMNNIMTKLQASNRIHAIVRAVILGLVC